MLLVTGFATVSQIANHHFHISRCIIKFCYATLELTNVTSQDCVKNSNDPWKY